MLVNSITVSHTPTVSSTHCFIHCFIFLSFIFFFFLSELCRFNGHALLCCLSVLSSSSAIRDSVCIIEMIDNAYLSYFHREETMKPEMYSEKHFSILTVR